MPLHRELMIDVAKLGFHCRELQKFCTWETRACMQSRGSPYRCAYAQGLSGTNWACNSCHFHSEQWMIISPHLTSLALDIAKLLNGRIACLPSAVMPLTGIILYTPITMSLRWVPNHYQSKGKSADKHSRHVFERVMQCLGLKDVKAGLHGC